MMARTACPECGTKYDVPDSAFGKTTTCKQCDQRFDVRPLPPATAKPAPKQPDSILFAPTPVYVPSPAPLPPADPFDLQAAAVDRPARYRPVAQKGGGWALWIVAGAMAVAVIPCGIVVCIAAIATLGTNPHAPPAAEEPERKMTPKERAAAKKLAEEELDSDGLVLMLKTLEGQNEEFGAKITGTVVNRRNKTLRYAQITFSLYDAAGDQIGSALANINGVEPGGRWKFEASTFGKKFATYRVSSLSGY